MTGPKEGPEGEHSKKVEAGIRVGGTWREPWDATLPANVFLMQFYHHRVAIRVISLEEIPSLHLKNGKINQNEIKGLESLQKGNVFELLSSKSLLIPGITITNALKFFFFFFNIQDLFFTHLVYTTLVL